MWKREKLIFYLRAELFSVTDGDSLNKDGLKIKY